MRHHHHHRICLRFFITRYYTVAFSHIVIRTPPHHHPVYTECKFRVLNNGNIYYIQHISHYITRIRCALPMTTPHIKYYSSIQWQRHQRQCNHTKLINTRARALTHTSIYLLMTCAIKCYIYDKGGFLYMRMARR